MHRTQSNWFRSHRVEKTRGGFEIDVGMNRIAACFTQQDVVGLVLLKNIENHFGAPLNFAERLLFAEEIPVNHHAGLGGVAEMIFQKVRTGERGVEIFREIRW